MTLGARRRHERGRPGLPFVLGGVACVFAIAACATPDPGDAEGAPGRDAVVALVGVTVVDGTGAPPQPDRTVLLRGERIEEVGPAGEVRVPEGAERLDLAGHFVVPGFVDLHVHFPEDASVHAAMLDLLLEHGITTMLNPGARPGAGVELRERIRSGALVGPRLLTAGPIVEMRPAEGGLAGWSAEVSTEAEIRAAVRAQVDAGADFVKLYRRLPPELVAAAIEEAHARDRPVIGHMGATTWTEAAGLGIDMLVHSGYGTPMDELVDLPDPDLATDAEWYRNWASAPTDRRPDARFAALVRQLVEHDVTVVPTLSITQASALGKDAALLPEFETHRAPDAGIANWWGAGWRERHPQHGEVDPGEDELLATVYMDGVLGIVRAYHERGVRLGVGTDVGNAWMTPGVVYHRELALYQEAGIPPLAILTMATRHGAEALGLESDVGTVEAGKRADLVVLAADPTVDIRNARRIERVILGGREVFPQNRPSPPLETGHAPVNGIEMYYEVHGRADGVPLVLLHGGGSTIDVTWGRILPHLAAERRVIAVEEQGHGRTTDRDAPVRFDTSADDVAALLEHLGIEHADLFGFSNGASVALEVALRHPQRVRRLVFASSFTRRDGAYPEFWDWMKQADFSNMPQPLKDAFLRVNPDERQLRVMHDKDAERMRGFEDVPDERVRAVRAPTLVIAGDRDVVRPEHAVELTRLIPEARLLILPGNHGDYLGELVMTEGETDAPRRTAALVLEFLR